MAVSFLGLFSQAKGFGKVWSEGLFLGVTEVHERMWHTSACHQWSNERGEHLGVKTTQCLCMWCMRSLALPGRGSWHGDHGQGVQGVLPSTALAPTELRVCSEILLPNLCRETATTCKWSCFPKDLCSSFCAASVWLSLHCTNFVSAFFLFLSKQWGLLKTFTSLD